MHALCWLLCLSQGISLGLDIEKNKTKPLAGLGDVSCLHPGRIISLSILSSP